MTLHAVRVALYQAVIRSLLAVACAIEQSQIRFDHAHRARMVKRDKAFRKKLRALEIVMLRRIAEDDQAAAARGDVEVAVVNDSIAKGLVFVTDARCRKR